MYKQDYINLTALTFPQFERLELSEDWTEYTSLSTDRQQFKTIKGLKKSVKATYNYTSVQVIILQFASAYVAVVNEHLNRGL